MCQARVRRSRWAVTVPSASWPTGGCPVTGAISVLNQVMNPLMSSFRLPVVRLRVEVSHSGRPNFPTGKSTLLGVMESRTAMASAPCSLITQGIVSGDRRRAMTAAENGAGNVCRPRRKAAAVDDDLAFQGDRDRTTAKPGPCPGGCPSCRKLKIVWHWTHTATGKPGRAAAASITNSHFASTLRRSRISCLFSGSGFVKGPAGSLLEPWQRGNKAVRVHRALLAGSLALAGVVWAGTSAHAAPPSKFHLAGDTAGVVITSETDYADGTALAAERADRRPGHGLAADDRLLPP